MTLAEIAHRTTLERLGHLADVPAAEVRRGPGWMSVRTGTGGNDDNVVLSVGEASLDEAGVDAILDGMRGVPATWNVDVPDARLTEMLLRRGAKSERSGWWCGRAIGPSDTLSLRVVEASGDGVVDAYLDVLQECGWFDLAERQAQRVAMPRHAAFRHVVAIADDAVVGAALGFSGAALEIVDIAVNPTSRRRGVARALVGDLERWCAGRGTTDVFAAPSPDGAELFRALGFEFARVRPDVSFYLP